MPLNDEDQNSLLDSIINLAGGSLYPLSLSLLLPVFMYALVLEKEEKLVEMMKMNGLKIFNYWAVPFLKKVNYLFFLVLYLVTAVIFMAFGVGVLQITFFTQTNAGILFFVLLGWGLC